MLVLSEDDLRHALPIEPAMDAVADAFARLSAGQAHVPLRTRVPLPPGDGLALLMPAHLSGATGSGEAAFGVKAPTIFPGNPARFGLPAIPAPGLLFDATPGAPLALAIGAFSPDTREIPGATVARAHLVVDSRAAAGAEAGELILARGEGLLAADAEVAELGEFVLGRAAGRTSLDQITLFKSVGVAVQ